MKLAVKSGVSVEKALNYIRDFLEANYHNYAILKGNLNLYITLKDDENRDCPDNANEYVLGADNITDVVREKTVAAKNKTLTRWKQFVKYNEKRFQNVFASVELDKKYLETAKIKGRKLENIEKREQTYLKNLKELESISEVYSLVKALDESIKTDNITWYIIKHTGRKRTSYDYSISAYLIFKNINDFTGYFETDTYRNEGTGVLIEGLPYSG